MIEFKGPGDRLDYLTIRKSIGYANLYIATAKKAEHVTAENVTMSIFASEKNIEDFQKLIKNRILTGTDVPGIYSIDTLTDLPFQIVMLDELKGEAYAAYRVLR